MSNETQGNAPTPTTLTVDQALKSAVDFHAAGRLQDAEKLYRAILQVQPQHPDAHHNLGVLAVSVGKVGPALGHFKTALETRPATAQFWVSMIDGLIRANRLDDARAVLAQGQSHELKGPQVDALMARLSGASEAQPAPESKATAPQIQKEKAPAPAASNKRKGKSGRKR